MTFDLDDVRPPLSRDDVDLRVATRSGADGQLLWTRPRLYVRFRDKSATWVYRYTIAGKDKWLTLGEHSDKRSGGGKLTYGAARECAERLDLLRRHVPDLHELRGKAIETLRDRYLDPKHRAEIYDRIWPVLPASHTAHDDRIDRPYRENEEFLDQGDHDDPYYEAAALDVFKKFGTADVTTYENDGFYETFTSEQCEFDHDEK